MFIDLLYSSQVTTTRSSAQQCYQHMERFTTADSKTRSTKKNPLHRGTFTPRQDYYTRQDLHNDIIAPRQGLLQRKFSNYDKIYQMAKPTYQDKIQSQSKIHISKQGLPHGIPPYKRKFFHITERRTRTSPIAENTNTKTKPIHIGKNPYPVKSDIISSSN